MKEKLKAAYVFVKVWRFVSWTIVVLISVVAVPALIYEMSRSGCTFVKMWQEYQEKEDECNTAHVLAALQNVEYSRQAVHQFMNSYRFSIEQIKKANPAAEVSAVCPFKSSRLSEQINESGHILMHALTISAPAITLDGETEQNEMLQKLSVQVLNNKEQVYASIYASMNAVKKSLEAEIERVKTEIGKKQALKEELMQQIDAIRFPMVRKEVEHYIPRSSVDLPEKSVYKDSSNYQMLHNYGVELPVLATYSKETQVLDPKCVKNWQESVTRLAAWLPMVINREPLKETLMKDFKDMDHVLSKEDIDRIKTLNGRIDQINKEIGGMLEKMNPIVIQLQNMKKADKYLQTHKNNVLRDWQVDADYNALCTIADAALKEKNNYTHNMALCRAFFKMGCREEIDRALNLYEKKNRISWHWEDIKEQLSMVRILVALVTAWLVWFLMLVVGDFMVCPLVRTLRVQGLENAFAKEKE